MAALVFWIAVLSLLHTYLFYPLVLLTMDRVEGVLSKAGMGRGHRPSRAGPPWMGDAPSVSLVVAAYNEAGCIAEKVKNSLEIDYPSDRFELLVGSDGSTDGTDALVSRVEDARVRLSAEPRAGKTSVLNRCIPAATGDVVVLSDANTMISPEAVRRMVRHFEDPEVGAVCGRLRLFNRERPRDDEESTYWSYESTLKSLEGKHGAVMGANGGLYAIRRHLFTRLPPSTIVDDFVIPMRLMAQGYRMEYEPEALAWEETTGDPAKEFRRRTRIAAGNFQSLGLVPRLLLPSAGFKAFAFWSHKVLRWLAPMLMAAAAVSNLFLLSHGLFYRLTFLAQLAFYLVAFAGRAGLGRGRAFRIAHYFVAMNLAIAVGFWRFLRHTQKAAWDVTR